MRFLITYGNDRETTVEADIYELPVADSTTGPSPFSHVSFYLTNPHHAFGDEGNYELLEPPVFSVAVAALQSVEIVDRSTVADD